MSENVYVKIILGMINVQALIINGRVTAENFWKDSVGRSYPIRV